MLYTDYLKSKHWFQLRQLKLEQATYRCERCGENKNLEVHHIFYRNLLDCKLYDLQVLCDICHKDIHGIDKGLSKIKKTRETYSIVSKIFNSPVIIKETPPLLKKDIKKEIFLILLKLNKEKKFQEITSMDVAKTKFKMPLVIELFKKVAKIEYFRKNKIYNVRISSLVNKPKNPILTEDKKMKKAILTAILLYLKQIDYYSL